MKEDKILSGLEESFDTLDEKFDRLEMAITGLFVLNFLIIGVSIWRFFL